MLSRKKRSIRKQVDHELRESWDTLLETEGRHGEERLTDAERTELMRIAISGALFWGLIVEAITLVGFGIAAFDSGWPKEWWALFNGPIVVVGYFLWKRRQMLDKSAAMWREKRNELLNEEVERRVRGDTTEPEAVPRSDEHQSSVQDWSRIVSDFGEYLEHEPAAGELRDANVLPHDKETILDAICAGIIQEQDGQRFEALKAVAVFLEDFQEGVGSQPLSLLPTDAMAVDPATLSHEELTAMAERIATNPDKERYEAFQPLVQKDRERIQARVNAAVKARVDYSR